MKYVLLILAFVFFSFNDDTSADVEHLIPDEVAYELDSMRLSNKIEEARKFVRTNHLNQNFVILLDMKIHSGRNRFFVCDLNADSILRSGLVSHGCCDLPWTGDESKESPSFSNQNESHCSSLGKYRIGKRGWSSFGIHVNYKMHGLESSNSNAFERLIVLHSWDEVRNHEVFPEGSPEGWGCPAISNDFMKYVDKKLKIANEPVLLWVYN